MPEMFGRYELLERIGVGGMGEVFRARLEVPAAGEKILVIKRILPSLSAQPEFLRLFVNEARVALPLTHGNVVSTFEFGEVDGQYFLAMEYIHGQNLQALIAQAREAGKPVPVAAALFIAAELARGLAYAHDFLTPQGTRTAVMHLDVSPQNVLVSYDGSVKLTDFGIARARLQATAASPGIVRGKAAYVAPEQLTGGPIDARADLFALGCVLYELLVGVPPYPETEDRERAEGSRQLPVAPPGELRPEAAAADSVVLKALEYDPALRWQRASELNTALMQALSHVAPGFGPSDLSEWLKDLFAWELLQSLGAAGQRDRLLVEMEGARALQPNSPTVELPDLGRPIGPNLKERRPGRTIAIAVGAGLAIALAVGALLLFGPGRSAPTDAPPPGANAKLSLTSWPSSQVALDGTRPLGLTPVRDVDVTPGTHVILFLHPELGLRKEVTLTIAAGEERAVAVKLER